MKYSSCNEITDGMCLSRYLTVVHINRDGTCETPRLFLLVLAETAGF